MPKISSKRFKFLSSNDSEGREPMEEREMECGEEKEEREGPRKEIRKGKKEVKNRNEDKPLERKAIKRRGGRRVTVARMAAEDLCESEYFLWEVMSVDLKGEWHTEDEIEKVFIKKLNAIEEGKPCHTNSYTCIQNPDLLLDRNGFDAILDKLSEKSFVKTMNSYCEERLWKSIRD